MARSWGDTMSVIVTANYKDESFEVEIFRDGSLEFPGRDMEREQTLAALGESRLRLCALSIYGKATIKSPLV